MGVQMPIVSTVFGAGSAVPQSSYNYKDLGTNIDCSATSGTDGQYKVQLTVAEYVVSRAPVAFELPTPASWYELHVTNCVEGSTEHVAAVPAEKWVPVGAFAGLIVVAADAAAENAMTAANGTVKRKRIRRNTIVSS